jgi:hypothetical protein
MASPPWPFARCNDGLTAEGQLLSLIGPIEELLYPLLCPCCGAQASTPLPITRVFKTQWASTVSGNSKGGVYYTAATAKPLFCATCVAAHQQQARAQTPTLRQTFSTALFSEPTLPAIGTLMLGLFFLKETVPDVIKSPDRWLVLMLPLIFLLIGYGSARQAWKSTWWKRIPAPTDISRAFDFGDDASNAFKTEPRNYVIRNPACAEAFTQTALREFCNLLFCKDFLTVLTTGAPLWSTTNDHQNPAPTPESPRRFLFPLALHRPRRATP